MKQREIKLRAWHEPTKRMFPVYTFSINQQCGTSCIYGTVFEDTMNGVGTETTPARMDDCILMQFTGMKDRDKKEIYEGDLISNVHVTFEIYWDNKLSAFRAKRTDETKTQKYLYELPISDKYWVSGNVFQIPAEK